LAPFKTQLRQLAGMNMRSARGVIAGRLQRICPAHHRVYGVKWHIEDSLEASIPQAAIRSHTLGTWFG